MREKVAQGRRNYNPEEEVVVKLHTERRREKNPEQETYRAIQRTEMPSVRTRPSSGYAVLPHDGTVTSRSQE